MPRNNLSLVTLMGLATLAAGIVLGRVQLSPTAHAQQAVPSLAAEGQARKWEYSVLYFSATSTSRKQGGTYTGHANICYFQAAGCKLETIEVQGPVEHSLVLLDRAKGKAIAKLAEDGWEMFLLNPPVTGSIEFYFKRPKP